jgi:hypothetical protein
MSPSFDKNLFWPPGHYEISKWKFQFDRNWLCGTDRKAIPQHIEKERQSPVTLPGSVIN